MTECERILTEHVVPEDYFKEEVRCGFKVTTEIKKIWAVNIDLMKEFQRVALKYNLRYFAFGGTMLGAVRHNGFIPWDDDIDLIMPMDDYKKLEEIAPGEFASPYSLQTPALDKGYFFSYMKMRNKNTTFMSRVFSAQTFNQGAFLDIFPLVECPPEKMKEQRDRIFPSIMRCSNYMKRGCESLLNEKQMERYRLYTTDNPLADYLLVQKELDNPEYKNCGYYTHASFFYNYDEYHVWRKEYWDNPVMFKFEIIELPLPCGWDEILKEYFGDYMSLPPVEKRVSAHSNTIIDMDKPYTEYIKPSSSFSYSQNH